MITIIHGPERTGKSFHKQAFARHYGCSHIVDGWDPHQCALPERPNRLVLTVATPETILQALLDYDDPITAFQLIDIATARQAIGVDAFAPGIAERLAR